MQTMSFCNAVFIYSSVSRFIVHREFSTQTHMIESRSCSSHKTAWLAEVWRCNERCPI